MPTSLRLQHTYQLEAAYYASHPEDDNFRIAYCWKHLPRCGMYLDRSGKICYVYHPNYKVPYFTRQIFHLHLSPAMARIRVKAYISVYFHDGRSCLRPLLHQVIADLFLDNDNLTHTQVDHLNGNHLDNRAENLERVTPEENIRRRYYNYYTRLHRPVPARFLPPSPP